MMQPKPRRRIFNAAEREAILHLRVLELEGRPIPLEIQKTLTAKQINSMWDADHYPIRHVDGGPTEPWNGQMLLNAKGAAFLKRIGIDADNEHSRKNAKIDIPQIAKAKRVTAEEEAFRHQLLAKAGRGDAATNSDVRRAKRFSRSQPMPGSRRSRYKRKMNGTVVPR